ncbi:TMhelix containing protein [Vibrio phage vB_VviC_ZQ26]|nr:TMhelix containing protein [Vibrio phage vB_VviC_ZQ26]
MGGWITELFDWMFYRQHVFYITIGLTMAVAWLWQNWLKTKEIKLDERKIGYIKHGCTECRERIWKDVGS